MINVSKITHRGEPRIRIQFKKNAELIRKVKSIEGRKWSQTKMCWHLPYSKESFENLRMVFGDNQLIFAKKKESSPPNPTNVKEKSSSQKRLKVKIVDYQFGNEIRKKVIGEKVIIRKKDLKWLEVFVPSDKKGWINVLQNINGRSWYMEKACWKIPNVKQSYRVLKKHIGLKNIQFNFEINAEIPEEYTYRFKKKEYSVAIKTKANDSLNETQKSAISSLIEQLTLKRLSHSTIKSYKYHLASVFIFFKEIEPKNISTEQVQQYILYQIKYKKISVSTQNSIINSVKAYWEKVLKLPPSKIEIFRPKKPKHLPNVFSQEEVIRLIEAPKNLKHKLILLLIYSAGLRLSEVVNIRVRDISLGRRVIFIKDGKGKKDRFVTLAEEVIPYLASYKKQYSPDYWLLEGQSGGQYSKRSVQNVFQNALKTSKVFAFGTVHTLRHSYATHCIENGFSTALLQEALGHGSIKTTEKYLHISSNALKKLRSPLDIIKDTKRNKDD